jgi:predicted Ser/Thr protein kinase
VKIYAKSFASGKVRGKHVAPHTLEIAAMWAILTRLEDPKKHNLALLQKLKLYDGKMMPGFTQDTVKELRKDTAARAWTASRRASCRTCSPTPWCATTSRRSTPSW